MAVLKVLPEAERLRIVREALRTFCVYRKGVREMPDVHGDDSWPHAFHGGSVYYSIPVEVMKWCRDNYGSEIQLHQPPRSIARRAGRTWATHGVGTLLVRSHAQAVEMRLRFC